MAAGVVKFFNATKGFGFIAPSSGEPDVFVHASGIDSPEGVNDGDEVEFEVVTDRRSGRANAVDVRVTNRAPAKPQSAGRVASAKAPGESLGQAAGAVKWFNTTKGFGFIAPDAGGPDVFVHASAVERAGLRDLQDGQRLEFEVLSDPRTGKLSAANLRTQ
ncbi:MAG: hypothetical protein BGN86_06235 [Caulobacterales bacterium 68-7]|nr:CspA family cold shock protein [Caulobacterales bacterium]OJU13539.1 MAG: hypothetical protein BGN86_06235 [Caulobacterales bacterium 68-7]